MKRACTFIKPIRVKIQVCWSILGAPVITGRLLIKARTINSALYEEASQCHRCLMKFSLCAALWILCMHAGISYGLSSILFRGGPVRCWHVLLQQRHGESSKENDCHVCKTSTYIRPACFENLNSKTTSEKKCFPIFPGDAITPLNRY